MKRSILAALLALPLLGSCIALAAAGAGAAATYGYVSYKNNEASTEFDRSVDLTWKACVHALKAQDYVIEGEPERGPTGGTIEAGSATVHVEREVGDTTRVRVRVGTFDSEDNRRLAKLLMEEIARRLGQ